MARFELVDDYVYCDVHGTIHERSIDPYDYGYGVTDVPGDNEPECGPIDWRKLWIGGADNRPAPNDQADAPEKAQEETV